MATTYTDEQVKDAYRAYVTHCYGLPVVPRIRTFEQFAAEPEAVEHYAEAATAAAEALNNL